MVIPAEDMSQVAAVSFYQNNIRCIRIATCSSRFEIVATHGSFRNLTIPDAENCAIYADFRYSESNNHYMQTWKKRTDLDDDKNKTWIVADEEEGFPWGFHSADIHSAQVNLSDSER
ncbi:unnamed protein product [Adineta ricciae]|uniref:Uncharacterized protein n=1 Tax=Adineta ricciae TaxID=249248 RepID=A0A816HRC2_ADIRI|nr:unnamed protein product [Adineta ricciae]